MSTEQNYGLPGWAIASITAFQQGRDEAERKDFARFIGLKIKYEETVRVPILDALEGCDFSVKEIENEAWALAWEMWNGDVYCLGLQPSPGHTGQRLRYSKGILLRTVEECACEMFCGCKPKTKTFSFQGWLYRLANHAADHWRHVQQPGDSDESNARAKERKATAKAKKAAADRGEVIPEHTEKCKCSTCIPPIQSWVTKSWDPDLQKTKCDVEGNITKSKYKEPRREVAASLRPGRSLMLAVADRRSAPEVFVNGPAIGWRSDNPLTPLKWAPGEWLEYREQISPLNAWRSLAVPVRTVTEEEYVRFIAHTPTVVFASDKTTKAVPDDKAAKLLWESPDKFYSLRGYETEPAPERSATPSSDWRTYQKKRVKFINGPLGDGNSWITLKGKNILVQNTELSPWIPKAKAA